jgi:hypothetical protein
LQLIANLQRLVPLDYRGHAPGQARLKVERVLLVHERLQISELSVEAHGQEAHQDRHERCAKHAYGFRRRHSFSSPRSLTSSGFWRPGDTIEQDTAKLGTSN